MIENQQRFFWQPGQLRVLTPAQQKQRNPEIQKAQPTPAQIEAGNYQKQHRRFQGLDLSIENPAGSVRKGVDRDGHEWRTRMRHDYGYIRGSKGVDKDHVDCYLGPHEAADFAYIVHQRKAGQWDRFDEDKVMLGFKTQKAARRAYLAHYDDPRFLGDITSMPMEEFKIKVRATAHRPAMIKALPATIRLLFFKAFQPGLFDAPVTVSGHVTKRGTVVSPYQATRKKRPEPPLAPDLFAEADRKEQETAERRRAEEEKKAQAKQTLSDLANRSATPKEFIENIPNDSTEIVFHQTGDQAARKIMAAGFKTGHELGVAEKRRAVYAAGNTINEGLYARTETGEAHAGQTPAKIPIDIRGLRLFDATEYGSSSEIGAEITRGDLKRFIEQGYDGVIRYLANGDVYEVALSATIASQRRMTEKQIELLWRKLRGKSEAPPHNEPPPGVTRLKAWRKDSRPNLSHFQGGTFFYLNHNNPLTASGVATIKQTIDIPEKEILRLTNAEIEPFAMPSEALAERWFPKTNWKHELKDWGEDPNDSEKLEQLIEMRIAKEALDQGYNAIVYGDQELQVIDPKYLPEPQRPPEPPIEPTSERIPRLTDDLINAVTTTALGKVLRPDEFSLTKPHIIGESYNNEDSIQKIARVRGEDVDTYRQRLQQHTEQLVTKSQIWTRVGQKAFGKILREGFKNQYQTNSSGGALTPETRQAFEEFFFGYPKRRNDNKLPDEEAIKRPIYGYLSDHQDGCDEIDLGGLRQYGDIAIRFKDTVRDVSTFCGDDSLSVMCQAIMKGKTLPEFAAFLPSPVNRPSYRSLRLSDGAGEIIDPLRVDGPHLFPSSRYLEVQIHGGGLTHADIAEVVFTAPPIPDTIKRTLKKLGIPWRMKQ